MINVASQASSGAVVLVDTGGVGGIHFVGVYVQNCVKLIVES